MSIDVTADGYCIAAGTFKGSLVFGPLSTATAFTEAFVIKINPEGVPFWGLLSSGSDQTVGTGVGLGNSFIIVAGRMRTPTTFITNTISAQGEDFFLWKITY